MNNFFIVFFFQAEDGIRDLTVTGVQTCALPIYPSVRVPARSLRSTRATAKSWPCSVTPRRIPTILRDRKSTRLNSSHSQISYAVFCLKKKKETHHSRHGRPTHR